MSKSALVLACVLSATALQAEDKPADTAEAPAEKADPATASDTKLTSDAQKISYLLGSNFGSRLKGDDIDVDVEALLAGVRDAVKGAKSPLSEEETARCIEMFQQQMQEKQAKMSAADEAAGAENAKAGEEFLAKNGKRDGVTTTKSGLQYEVLKKGDGKKPSATDTVKVHYHGTLIDGSVFDSSVDRGEPISFPLNQVIPGWTEGVQLMPVGAKYKFFIPAKLAYGERGSGPIIGPNSTLVFEVELLGIE